MDYEKIKEKLKQNMSEHRYQHTIGTTEAAVKLAKLTGCDEKQAYEAALIHDCAKDIPFDEQIMLSHKYNIELDEVTLLAPHILHAAVGAALAKNIYGITDEEVLAAVACHTTGKENMNLLEKILFIADLIEDNRKYAGSEEIRKLAYVDFDAALIKSFDKIINFVLNQQGLLHPATVNARNYLIKEKLKGEK